MKKQLFLGLTACVSLASIAQNTHRTVANAKCVKEVTFKSIPTEPSVFNISSTSSAANKIAAGPYKRIAGSSNVFGVLVPASRCLQYNAALNTVGLVYRQGSTWTGIPNQNSGTISYVWSANNGTTWDSTVVLASTTKLQRYPCGTIYNPSGNTNPANAYAVASGAWLPNLLVGAKWQGVFFGSKQLLAPGSTSVTPALYIDNLALLAGQTKQDFSRYDPQTTADGVVHISGDISENANGATSALTKWRGTMLNKGVFNAGSFTWTVDSLKPSFKKDLAGEALGYSSSNSAWNEAGTIGYVIFYGIDANAVAGTSQNSYQPFVYKTINSGVSWSRFAPLFNFTTIPVINNRLFVVNNNNNSTLAKPFIAPFEGASATVDATGNLHLFCGLKSASTENVDSLDYSYSPNYNKVWAYLMDFKTTATGWDAMVVDSLNNSGPTDTQTNWKGADQNFNYNARCQISRTTDGNNLIYSWADSDSNFVTSHISTLPDIYMKGYDVTKNKMTCKNNMTAGKIGINSLAYFFYTSPIIAKPTATTFQIPTSIVKSNGGTNNGDNPISQYYIHDNMFSASEFTVTPNGLGCNSTGIGFNELYSSISSLNFYPSPASTNGIIDVVLHDNAKMEVVILNSVGQTVYSSSVAGVAGGNKVNVDLSNLNSGLYFYQVRVANSQSITKKFVIEK